MTNLDLSKAIEAGALASKRNWYPAVTEPCDDHREDARACLEAALPHIRAELAKQVRSGHEPYGGHNPNCHCGIPPGDNPDCTGCNQNWPCDTERAAQLLEGKSL